MRITAYLLLFNLVFLGADDALNPNQVVVIQVRVVLFLLLVVVAGELALVLVSALVVRADGGLLSLSALVLTHLINYNGVHINSSCQPTASNCKQTHAGCRPRRARREGRPPAHGTSLDARLQRLHAGDAHQLQQRN